MTHAMHFSLHLHPTSGAEIFNDFSRFTDNLSANPREEISPGIQLPCRHFSGSPIQQLIKSYGGINFAADFAPQKGPATGFRFPALTHRVVVFPEHAAGVFSRFWCHALPHNLNSATVFVNDVARASPERYWSYSGDPEEDAKFHK